MKIQKHVEESIRIRLLGENGERVAKAGAPLWHPLARGSYGEQLDGLAEHTLRMLRDRARRESAPFAGTLAVNIGRRESFTIPLGDVDDKYRLTFDEACEELARKLKLRCLREV